MNLDPTSDVLPKLDHLVLIHVPVNLDGDPEGLGQLAQICDSPPPMPQHNLYSATVIQGRDRGTPSFGSLHPPPRSAKPLDANIPDLTFVSGCGSYLGPPDYDPEEYLGAKKVVFEGSNFDAHTRPQNAVWKSCPGGIKTVEFNFKVMDDEGSILATLRELPETVENITFTAAEKKLLGFYQAEASGVDKLCNSVRWGGGTSPHGVRQFNGTLNLDLASGKSHGKLLRAMVQLRDVFKFNLKHIKYHLTCNADIGPLALLVNECKDTLKTLDIKCSKLSFEQTPAQVESLDFSQQRALENVRIEIPRDVDPSWISKAIDSIPKPTFANPRTPSLRFEFDISPPRDAESFGDEISTWEAVGKHWSPIEIKLSKMIKHTYDDSAESNKLSGITAWIKVIFDGTSRNVDKARAEEITKWIFPRHSESGRVWIRPS